MKRKRSVATANKSRMLVHVPTKVQPIIQHYCGHCGYSPGIAVLKLIEIGHAAFGKQTASVDAQRALILADGKLAEINRGHSKRVAAVKRQKRALRANAGQSTASPDDKK